MDIAFFPLDPRQGTMFEAGANFFILSVKPRILIPMHYFHRAEVAMEYARTASTRGTEVIAMPGYGEQLGVEMDEEGYLNLYLPEPEPEETGESGAAEEDFLTEDTNRTFSTFPGSFPRRAVGIANARKINGPRRRAVFVP